MTNQSSSPDSQKETPQATGLLAASPGAIWDAAVEACCKKSQKLSAGIYAGVILPSCENPALVSSALDELTKNMEALKGRCPDALAHKETDGAS